MPVKSPPNPVSFHDAKEELLKSTGVNPEYPKNQNIRIDVPYLTSSAVDPNGQIGLNPDGTWSVAKLYNWDTWKTPRIPFCVMDQFGPEGGLRVTIIAEKGDLARSAFWINVSKQNVGGAGTMLCRVAPEFNPLSNNPSEKYCHTYGVGNGHLRVQSLNVVDESEALGYDSFDAEILPYGDFTVGMNPPNENWPADPKVGGIDQKYALSFVIPNITPESDPQTAKTNYYTAQVRVVDGRQFDTLAEGATDFSVDTSGTGLSNYARQGKLVNAKITNNVRHSDAEIDGNPNAIALYSGLSELELTNMADTTVGINASPFPTFPTYLTGGNIIHWYYYMADWNDTQEPYFPSDTIQTPHPYNDVGFDFDPTVQMERRWFMGQGNSVIINNLNPGTLYRVWVLGFNNSDLSRYQKNGVTVGAPEIPQSRGNILFADLMTITDVGTVNQISEFTWAGTSANRFSFTWKYPSIPTSWIVEHQDSGGAWVEAGEVGTGPVQGVDGNGEGTGEWFGTFTSVEQGPEFIPTMWRIRALEASALSDWRYVTST